MLTNKKALEILKQPDRIGCNLIKANDEESCKYNQESIEAFNRAVLSIEKLEKIEQIVKDHDNDRMPEDFWYIDKIREVLENG